MQDKDNKIEKEIQGIVQAYEKLVLKIDKKAQDDISKRAYGGIIRAGKGKLVESIAKEILRMAWEDLGQEAKRLKIDRRQIKIPLRKEYLGKIKNSEVKKYIRNNIGKYYYGQKTDLHVYIDDKFIMGIECKAYTENAMMKRILVDFTLLKQVYPQLVCVLFQLESQLGGDYSSLTDCPLGSFRTHTLLSYFDVDLNIITLLKGERKVDRPIHKPEYFKPLTKKGLQKSIQIFKTLLSEYK